MKTATTHSAKETKALGKKYAKELWKTSNGKEALVVALQGELGSGKTTFAQGFAQGLGVEDNVLSPTFVIIREYEASGDRRLFHMDCYRLQNSKDLLELDWEEIVSDPSNIILLEWPERVESLLPKTTIRIQFQPIDETTRRIMVQN